MVDKFYYRHVVDRKSRLVGTWCESFYSILNGISEREKKLPNYFIRTVKFAVNEIFSNSVFDIYSHTQR